jgi:signal transduction histidine kinase
MRLLGQSRLTARILFWVICTSVLMFSVVTAFTVWQEREEMYRAVQQDADRNISRNTAAISIALWNFDQTTLDATLLALTQSGSIVRAEVRDQQGRRVSKVERADAKSRPDAEWEIPVIGPEDSGQIGMLKISESYTDVHDVFARNLATQLISELTKIGGLAALLFIVVYSVIARPLQTLAMEVSNLKPLNALTPLRRRRIFDDELDTLVNSINRFRSERAGAEDALHRDIAERMQVQAALNKSESELSEALRIAQLAYWEYDIQSGEFSLNDNYYSLCRTREKHVGGYHLKSDEFLHKLVFAEDAPAFVELLRQAVQAQPTDRLGQIEVRLLSADGSKRWMRVHCKFDRSNRGEAARLIGAIQDITQRKLAEDALWATRSELARVTRLTTMGQMGASIAHEINQPLTAIVLNSNAGLRWLAQEPPRIDEAQDALRQITDDGLRAGEVITSIRAMFKNEGKKRILIDVNVIIRDVLRMVDVDLQNRGVSVSTELSDGLPKVVADPVQMQQVFLNLIVNAIEAMDSITNLPRLLQIRSESRDTSGILVVVEDFGAGIDARDMDRIFDAFFTTKSSGMGMGLSICRSIVESHNGQLWALPGTVRGSIFHVALPGGTPDGAP